MRLSNPKINHLARLIADNISVDSNFRILRDKNEIRLRIKMIITDELRLENEIDKIVRKTLGSLSKSPPEGSKEWDVLYEKYYEEEMNRRSRSRFDGIRRLS